MRQNQRKELVIKHNSEGMGVVKMAENGLSKAERLSGKKSIDVLFEKGSSGFVFPFKYVYSMSAESGNISASHNTKVNAAPVSVLFSVPKRQHKRANKRNLLKRRMREAYRTNKHALNRSVMQNQQVCNLGLIYTSPEELSQQTIENSIKKILAVISAKS